ncbi:hypothetical protein PENSPDRAFT_655750 [Peniophora sp. CONT]|nr:hypothetical protein PENSPDRAFT_655750 [Peniophora sp. CONT]
MSSSPNLSPVATSSNELAQYGSSTSTNQLLSYPTYDVEASTSSNKQTQSKANELLPERLYIGNLHPAVTEHTLIQIFSKYGKMSNLDFLYHKTGALKGKPRGYAFIEYANSDDATTALASAHGKLLRGRKLVVTHANQAPMDAAGTLPRRAVNEAGRPTTLSLIKGASAPRNRDAISALEAKLRQMERDDSAAAIVTPPLEHPLPAKPTLAAAMAALPNAPFPAPKASATTSSTPASPRIKHSPLPPGSKPSSSAPGSKSSTPLSHKPSPKAFSSAAPFKHPVIKPKTSMPISVSTSSVPSKRPAPSMKGVKLVKKKDKGPLPSSQDTQAGSTAV